MGNGAQTAQQRPAWAFFYARMGGKEKSMADEAKQPETPATEPQGEGTEKTDWKAEARKWEARAKKSAAAEQELEELKQKQMTEQERTAARAEKAEAELAELKAEQERLKAAKDVAIKTGVPLNLLEFCKDREAMEDFARQYNAAQPITHSAATAPQSRITISGEGKLTGGELFAQAVKDAGIFK